MDHIPLPPFVDRANCGVTNKKRPAPPICCPLGPSVCVCECVCVRVRVWVCPALSRPWCLFFLTSGSHGSPYLKDLERVFVQTLVECNDAFIPLVEFVLRMEGLTQRSQNVGMHGRGEKCGRRAVLQRSTTFRPAIGVCR